MFIKISKLDAVLKKAYKGAGIHLERQGDVLAVGTAYLYLEADLNQANNEFKAIITKYNGEIPQPGFSKTISEDKEQIAFSDTIFRNLIQRDYETAEIVKETDFRYKGETVMQIKLENVVTVPEREWAVYDESQMDDKEEIIQDWRRAGNIILTKSEQMALAYIYKNPDETLERLSEVVLA